MLLAPLLVLSTLSCVPERAHSTEPLSTPLDILHRPCAFGTSAFTQDNEHVVEIRIQGNFRTLEDEILRIAAVKVGDPVAADTLQAVQERLESSGKFEDVEVRKRWRTIDSTEDIVLLIVVREVPGGSTNPMGRAIRSLARPMVLPVLDYADGYGITYGARLSPVGIAGRDTHVSIPLTWGATRQAAVEFDRPVKSLVITRVGGSGGILRRNNPFYDEHEVRTSAEARVERAFGRWVRAGATGSINAVSFGTIDESLGIWGADVTFDTRATRGLPRNAVFLQAGWDHLSTGDVNRYNAEARGYIGVPGGSVVAVRALRGSASAALPSYEQYLFGGSAFGRGFKAGYDAGDNIVLGSVEWRIPLTSPVNFGRIGANLFADTGTVWAAGERLEQSHFNTGVGAGVFFNAAVVNFNLDVARGLNNEWKVHVSLGFQF